jgi:hypothetical protein
MVLTERATGLRQRIVNAKEFGEVVAPYRFVSVSQSLGF